MQRHDLNKKAANTYLPEQEPTNYLVIALGKTGPEVAPHVTRKKKRRRTKKQSQELTL